MAAEKGSTLSTDEIMERAEQFRQTPQGAVVGKMPERQRDLLFASGDEGVDSTLRCVIENLLHLSPYAMCITDMQKPDEPIIYANEMFCEWSEYPESYIVGRNCRFLQGPETLPETVNAMREAIKNGKEFRGIVRNYSRTGVHLWNNLVMTPIKNKHGVVTHYTGIQNFSHEAPNTDNTPVAPPTTAFNPLATHLNWQPEAAALGTGGVEGKVSRETALTIVTDLEAASATMSPKITPKRGVGIRDESMDDRNFAEGQSPKRPQPKMSAPSSPSAMAPPSPGSPLPLRRRTKDGQAPLKVVALTAAEPGVPAPNSERRSTLRNPRRQAKECTILPDKDVWMELILRSLCPESVPMLPQAGGISEPLPSEPGTYSSFKIAQDEKIVAAI